MEISIYKIGRITYTQDELTWGQSKTLLRLYQKFADPAFKNEDIRIKDLQQILIKYNLLDRFFGIILKPRWDFYYILSGRWIGHLLSQRIQIDKAKNSLLGQIFSDFFLLNRKLMSKLSEYGDILAMITQATELLKKEKAIG